MNSEPHMFVGCRQMRITDPAENIEFPVLVMYPTDVPSAPVAFGPYTIEVSTNAPVADGRYPLVVISHGNSGSHLLYRGITTCLARNGYVVALVQHHGNNREDNHLADTYQNLVYRPRHVRHTIDAVAADPFFAHVVQADNVAIVGHSIGGYTALAVAGGTPWYGRDRPVDVVADSRVRALVLMAPATPWYLPGDSLRDVAVPILMFVAEHDPYTPRWQADIVLDRVPDRDRVTLVVVPNAGHFSFLSPFPPAMRSPAFLPSTDPPGFDREAFHAELPGQVLRYLDACLKQ